MMKKKKKKARRIKEWGEMEEKCEEGIGFEAKKKKKTLKPTTNAMEKTRVIKRQTHSLVRVGKRGLELCVVAGERLALVVRNEILQEEKRGRNEFKTSVAWKQRERALELRGFALKRVNISYDVLLATHRQRLVGAGLGEAVLAVADKNDNVTDFAGRVGKKRAHEFEKAETKTRTSCEQAKSNNLNTFRDTQRVKIKQISQVPPLLPSALTRI